MSRWHRHGEERIMPAGIERGRDGYSGIWALDQPGCYALVPPGADPVERIGLALMEFATWGHRRSGGRENNEPGRIEIVQAVDSGADVRAGQTTACFLHDREAPGPREFPLWANSHDAALDELRDLALSLSPALLAQSLAGQRSAADIVRHCMEEERLLADRLRPGAVPEITREDGSNFRHLQDAHTWLQQAVCDAPADLKVRRDAPGEGLEDWSVRKVMRRSIWHLRYHTWEIRRAVGGIWLS